MAKFRKKPVVIEAMQIPQEAEAHKNMHSLKALSQPVGEWIKTNGGKVFPNFPAGGLTIPTLEGDMRAEPGDWIIKGVKGEFYPCKPDIFDATYEAAE
jgi:hypothetical protein